MGTSTKKAYRFNDKQKGYLEQRFNIGQRTGRKVEADAVSKDMRHARDVNGNRLFGVSEFLAPQQISSFSPRLAAKVGHGNKEVTEPDVRAGRGGTAQLQWCKRSDTVESSADTPNYSRPI